MFPQLQAQLADLAAERDLIKQQVQYPEFPMYNVQCHVYAATAERDLIKQQVQYPEFPMYMYNVMCMQLLLREIS